jgi:2-C-methyl-D-erythritol 2,4-cyclodiphosphate synthase
MDLLAECAQRLVEANFRIGNVDATIVVQDPKLAPFITQMRINIAARLHIDFDRVSVKAKTSEGMGYTGDGSGIVAYAVALIEEGR